MREKFRKTGIMPPALEKKPHLHWYLNDIMQAYLHLRDRGGFSQAMLPVTVSDIRSYAEMYTWQDDLEFFCQCIFKLDNEYLRINAQKAENRAAAKKAAKKG